MAEILAELPRLDEADRHTVLLRLLALDQTGGIEESPETLAAIDAGIHSLESSPALPLAAARQRLAGWTGK